MLTSLHAYPGLSEDYMEYLSSEWLGKLIDL